MSCTDAKLDNSLYIFHSDSQSYQMQKSAYSNDDGRYIERQDRSIACPLTPSPIAHTDGVHVTPGEQDETKD